MRASAHHDSQDIVVPLILPALLDLLKRIRLGLGNLQVRSKYIESFLYFHHSERFQLYHINQTYWAKFIRSSLLLLLLRSFGYKMVYWFDRSEIDNIHPKTHLRTSFLVRGTPNNIVIILFATTIKPQPTNDKIWYLVPYSTCWNKSQCPPKQSWTSNTKMYMLILGFCARTLHFRCLQVVLTTTKYINLLLIYLCGQYKLS
jgi:hypothetical protein